MNLTVSTLVRYLKNRLDSDRYLQNILVEGEISNFRHYQSGYIYFTLKDNKAAISCMMFPRDAYALRFDPKDGDQVLVKGDVSVYEASGQLQLYVKQMKPNGLGDLYLQYEELKRKLAAAGFFDESHKKPIPIFPKTIGVLTSSTGSVIRDIINVSTRRNPHVHIRLLPVPVQGPGAEIQIAEAIKRLGFSKSVIIADSAEPKSVAELRKLGLYRIKESVKGPDSIINGIQKLQQYQILVSPECEEIITELENYS